MSLAEVHAAINDFPVALLLASVAFDLAAGTGGQHRHSLQAAAWWCLNVGAAAAILAAISGLVAASRIDVTPSLSRPFQAHRAIAIVVALLFSGLAGWRWWRKNQLTLPEQQSYIMAAVVGALALIWAARLGGTLVFQHGIGVAR